VKRVVCVIASSIIPLIEINTTSLPLHLDRWSTGGAQGWSTGGVQAGRSKPGLSRSHDHLSK